MREVIQGYAPAVMQPRRCARRSQARKMQRADFLRKDVDTYGKNES